MKEILGLMMVGEGVIAMVHPRGHVRLWEGGARWWQRMMGPFANHPQLTRVVGAVEAVAGFYLASRQVAPRADSAI
jgi:hypothetical protein